jgi:hypothetical protein
MTLFTDSIFVNGPVFKCPFTKTVSVNNFINTLTNMYSLNGLPSKKSLIDNIFVKRPG